MDTWVRLGELAVDGGRVVLAALPVGEGVGSVAVNTEVQLAADLRVTHDLAAVVVRSGGGDGTYPVEGRVVYDADGTARLAEVRIVFLTTSLGPTPR